VRHPRDHQLVGVGAMEQLGELAEDGFRASDDVRAGPGLYDLAFLRREVVPGRLLGGGRGAGDAGDVVVLGATQ
jgi:hypothetical protein